MNVSIIIVNYKVKEKLIRCIKSINKSNINSYEIIVVDNEENSGLEKVLKKEFKDVVYIKNDKNLGFGGGNNLGAEYASGKY
ncbi:MAG: glycosyl transferase, partial [Candidatus Levybacteria bacterium CG10_big_fil_rev_8_21_14_0_10_35_13]